MATVETDEITDIKEGAPRITAQVSRNDLLHDNFLAAVNYRLTSWWKKLTSLRDKLTKYKHL